MRCPECNTEINDNEQYCPNCGTPIPHSDNYNDDDPQLSKGLVVFIVIGTIFLLVFGALYYNNHKNDPEYTQTAIEPDSNLADNHPANFTTEQKDTTAQDTTEAKEEEAAAQKVFNSIRKQPRHLHVKVQQDGISTSPDGSVDLNTPPTETQTKEAPTHKETTPKPNIEPIAE